MPGSAMRGATRDGVPCRMPAMLPQPSDVHTVDPPIRPHTAMDSATFLPCDATAAARAALDGIARTEDVHWSPDGRRIVLAGLARDVLLVMDVSLDVRGDSPRVLLSRPVEVRCAGFRRPHGVFWIDDRTLMVASREGDAVVVQPPPGEEHGGVREVAALQTLPAEGPEQVKTPGSVSVARVGPDLYEALVCNNYVDRVTRHLLDGRERFAVCGSAVLLSAGLGVPDGVAVSSDGAWIAISNHDRHCVYLYRNRPELDAASAPDGTLDGIAYPHGVRFLPDGTRLLVADAGTPCVHVFDGGDTGWVGAHAAVLSLRVLDDATYQRGRHNPQEGGPKGIALDPSGVFLAVTCEERPLAFVDLRPLPPAASMTEAIAPPDDVERLRGMLLRESTRCRRSDAALWDQAMQRAQALESSLSWRITAPLRWVATRLRR